MVHLQIALCSRQILAEHKFKANFAPRCLAKSYSFSHRTRNSGPPSTIRTTKIVPLVPKCICRDVAKASS